jgi:hypothetical protein
MVGSGNVDANPTFEPAAEPGVPAFGPRGEGLGITGDPNRGTPSCIVGGGIVGSGNADASTNPAFEPAAELGEARAVE